uniref:Syndecan binding protein (syntenin) 2 n=1 Tax=Neogobius melanostomus TaxID=47308 RepID=A0A8C6SIY2_9GOBI
MPSLLPVPPPVPSSLCPPPCALLPVPPPVPSSLCPPPCTLCPPPCALLPLPSSLCPPPSALLPLPSGLYPNLEELGSYMGLSLNSEELQRNMAVPVWSGLQVALPSSAYSGMLCPVTGADVGVRRAEIRPGVREVILCKDQDRKVGLRLRSIDNVRFTVTTAPPVGQLPAALAGLRFGDQVLQINGQNCAGWRVDKAHKALKAAAETRIEMAVQRTLTMIKDSSVTSINGQQEDSQIKDILSTSPSAMTITIMPKFIYEHMIKRMSSGLLRSAMDHSVPEV